MLNNKYGLNFRQILVMFCLKFNKEGLKYLLPVSKKEFETLQSKGYINSEKRVMIPLFVGEKEPQKLTVDWIHQYRDLFRGRKTGWMGDVKMCIERMKWFIKTYDYDKDTILKATRKYLDSLMGDYRYLIKAHKFIYRCPEGSKERESNLAIWCEEITRNDVGDVAIEKYYTDI